MNTALAALDPWVIGANYAEAGLWTALSATALLAALRRRSHPRRRAILAAVVLVAFGASDVVEAQTGAWWRPWWLLAWKGLSVVALVVLTIREWRVLRRQGPSK